MPKLGLTMASGTVTRWHKHAGDAVRAGEPLLEVSTDKINYEVEAPAGGTLQWTSAQEGDELACGTVLGLIALDDDAPMSQRPPLPAQHDTRASAASPQAAPDSSAAPGVIEAPRRPPSSNGARTVASPAARRLARQRGIALAEVRGTGPRGRVTLDDVHGYAATARPAAAARAMTTPPPQLPASRRAIYRKMTEVGTLPLAQVETVARVDALKALLERRGDFGWTAFAVYAVARLLRDHLDLRIDATTGAPFEQIDIGVAADTPSGLIVPVVRRADARRLAEIHDEIVRLAGAARTGALSLDDLGGACFSISNVGPQGVERVAPLPDPPQTAILGIGAATLRPAVVDGALVPAWMLTCVLTFDHRFVDGAPAARFLAAFARACGEPGALL